MQRFLTKKVLALQVIFLGAALFSTLIFPPLANGVIMAVLALSALQYALLLPAVGKGETLNAARTRCGKALLNDPILYISLALILIGIIRTINSGMTLEYLTDADIWAMSKPAAPGLPSAVNAGAARMELYALLATSAAALIIRNALGPAGKRFSVSMISIISGVVGWILFGISFFGNKFADSIAPSASVGFLFGFWSLIALCAYVDRHYRIESSDSFASAIFILGVGGNVAASLLYLQTGWLGILLLSMLLLLPFGFRTILHHASGRCLLSFITLLVALFGVLYAAIAFIIPQNPVIDKLSYLISFDYAEGWSKWFEMRETCTKIASSLWEKYSWWGTGCNGYAEYAGLATDSATLETITPFRHLALNDWWQMLCEQGIVGMALIIAGFIALLIPTAARLRALVLDTLKNKGKKDFIIFSLVIPFILLAIVLLPIQAALASPFKIYAMIFSVSVVLSAMPGYLPKQK